MTAEQKREYPELLAQTTEQADHGKRPRKNLTTPPNKPFSLVVATVTFTIGIIFAISASLSEGEYGQRGSDFLTLVRSEKNTLENTEFAVNELRQEISETIVLEVPEALEPPDLNIDNSIEISVKGPGVTVTLWDAPETIGKRFSNLDSDALVVHQQDTTAIMNAFWEGGAEAMSVQGIRITPMTKIRCVGNVIAVDGNLSSAPFVIKAIGNSDSLAKALDNSRAVGIYRNYVSAYGLGFSIETEQDMELVATAQLPKLDYISVMENS